MAVRLRYHGEQAGDRLGGPSGARRKMREEVSQLPPFCALHDRSLSNSSVSVAIAAASGATAAMKSIKQGLHMPNRNPLAPNLMAECNFL